MESEVRVGQKWRAKRDLPMYWGDTKGTVLQGSVFEVSGDYGEVINLFMPPALCTKGNTLCQIKRGYLLENFEEVQDGE